MEVAKMIPTTSLRTSYTWTQSPLIASAPMRLIALAPLAFATSQAGGMGFLAAGTDVTDLKRELQVVASLVAQMPLQGSSSDFLPIGVGFINWGVELEAALEALREHIPAAVWFFAPRKNADLVEWTKKIREMNKGKTKIWIQIGTVTDAIEVARSCHPDVLVVQGADAGGHGLAQGAGIVSLLPEVADSLRGIGMESIPLIAAGGIVEGRGTAACLALGGCGVAMGTRFLASKEANIAKGYQGDVLRTNDGGRSTVRTSVYDTLRGTEWPGQYNGRGIINQSYLDAKNGMITDENKKLYEEALQKGDHGWGESGRVTAYAGCGVGLVKELKYVKEIIDEVRQEVCEVLSKLSLASSKL
ncbi:MAG: hypothetical protein Q9161_000726 [Pseudevernia consocians]